jgi:predicted RNA-binding Zn-ribbon protein involved in translation (DUF1610 family)
VDEQGVTLRTGKHFAMSNNEPMICPKCGAVMNHHAMKIDYSGGLPGDDPAFDGSLQEVHTCPNCGDTELREV